MKYLSTQPAVSTHIDCSLVLYKDPAQHRKHLSPGQLVIDLLNAAAHLVLQEKATQTPVEELTRG